MSDTTTSDATALPTYAEITENWQWLEDAWFGKYVLYGCGDLEKPNNSTWVCTDCQCVDADPYEGECNCDWGDLNKKAR